MVSDSSPSLEALYDEFGNMVFAMAMNLLRDRDRAADAAQETWVRAARSLDSGHPPERPGAWLSTIVRRESYRLLSRKAHSALTGDDLIDTPPSESGELHEAMGNLSPEDVETLTWRYFDGLSIRQIQKRTGLARRTVNYRIHNALERLGKELKEP